MLILSSPASSVLDGATTAWVAAVVAAGGTVSVGRKTVVNNLITGLKADGTWVKLDRLWLFAAENSQSALIDLVALTEALPVGVTFTLNRGYAGNGSSQYIRTLFNAATQGVNWTVSSAHIAAWDNTDRAQGPGVMTGVQDDLSVSDLMPFNGSGIVTRINNGLGSYGTLANSTSKGCFIGQRNAGTETESFYNGVSCGTTSDSRNTVVSLPFYVCARSNNGDASSYTTDQVSMVSYGGRFIGTQALTYYNRLRAYMTAVGVP